MIPSPRTAGHHQYELTNHLGNVSVIVSDNKLLSANQSQKLYLPDVLEYQDYYPFGMVMNDRKGGYNAQDYRYGYNGKENDNEVKGESNQQDYGFRVYDPRVGRFLSVDPLTKDYPMLTPYQYASNRPIDGVDLDGLEYTRASGDVAQDNMPARDQSAPYITVDQSKFIKPAISVIGEDQLGVHLYNGTHPENYFRSRQLEVFKRTGQALQSGGLLTSAYYYYEKPTLGELENMSRIESNILNVFGGTIKSRPIVGRSNILISGIKSSRFQVASAKFDYFFGRVTKGDKHNIDRSAQNLNDLQYFGIRNEKQLLKVFEQGFFSDRIVKISNNTYGTTITKRVIIEKKGTIDIGFFYENNNFTIDPKVTTIIPKRYKNENSP